MEGAHPNEDWYSCIRDGQGNYPSGMFDHAGKSQGKEVSIPSRAMFPAQGPIAKLKRLSDKGNQRLNLDNQEYLWRLQLYLQEYGGWVPMAVPESGGCLFHALRRGIDVRRQYTNRIFRRDATGLTQGDTSDFEDRSDDESPDAWEKSWDVGIEVWAYYANPPEYKATLRVGVPHPKVKQRPIEVTIQVPQSHGFSDKEQSPTGEVQGFVCQQPVKRGNLVEACSSMFSSHSLLKRHMMDIHFQSSEDEEDTKC